VEKDEEILLVAAHGLAGAAAHFEALQERVTVERVWTFQQQLDVVSVGETRWDVHGSLVCLEKRFLVGAFN
jgi:hypothetical protein